MCREQDFKAVYETVHQVKFLGNKGFAIFFSRVLKLRYLVLQDIKYCIRPGFVLYLPGRTTTEQSYKFLVCVNIVVLFSLDILSQACEKHIETRFSLQQFRS